MEDIHYFQELLESVAYIILQLAKEVGIEGGAGRCLRFLNRWIHCFKDIDYQKQKNQQCPFTCGEAMEKYCDLKSNVLSPATIREYQHMRKNYFTYCTDIKLKKLSSEFIQLWVNKFPACHSPKTAGNTGLQHAFHRENHRAF